MSAYNATVSLKQFSHPVNREPDSVFVEGCLYFNKSVFYRIRYFSGHNGQLFKIFDRIK